MPVKKRKGINVRSGGGAWNVNFNNGNVNWNNPENNNYVRAVRQR